MSDNTINANNLRTWLNDAASRGVDLENITIDTTQLNRIGSNSDGYNPFNQNQAMPRGMNQNVQAGPRNPLGLEIDDGEMSQDEIDKMLRSPEFRSLLRKIENQSRTELMQNYVQYMREMHQIAALKYNNDAIKESIKLASSTS